MKQFGLLLLIGVTSFLLVACGSLNETVNPSAAITETQPRNNYLALLNISLRDEQGSVSVEVTPISIDENSIRFAVVMETHSIDLPMNLLELATLSNNLGIDVSPNQWEAPDASNHHVTGNLVFPLLNGEQSLFDNSSQLRLTIRDVDAAERVFVWNIGAGG